MLEPARIVGAGFGLPFAVFLFFLMLESLCFCGALKKLAPLQC
jgi:hypothetical protein